MKLNRTLALATCMVALLGSAGHTAEEPSPEWAMRVVSMNGMEGLRDIGVVVESIDRDFERMVDISRQRVQVHVELYLRKVSGLKVHDSPYRIPVICVNINARVEDARSAQEGGNGEVSISLRQPVYLERPMPSTGKRIWVPGASTWDVGRLFECGAGSDDGDYVLKVVTELLDNFQNEYLKANPDVTPWVYDRRR